MNTFSNYCLCVKYSILSFLCLCSLSLLAQSQDPFSGVLRKRRVLSKRQRDEKIMIKNPHMIEARSFGVVTVTNVKSQEESANSFSDSLGYYYQFMNWIQLGFESTVYKSDTQTDYSFLPGFIFNFLFEKSINNAFYIKANIGMSGTSYSEQALENKSELILFGEVGKRFALAENITWSPSVSINYFPDQDDYDPSLFINLLKFNLFF